MFIVIMRRIGSLSNSVSHFSPCKAESLSCKSDQFSDWHGVCVDGWLTHVPWLANIEPSCGVVMLPSIWVALMLVPPWAQQSGASILSIIWHRHTIIYLWDIKNLYCMIIVGKSAPCLLTNKCICISIDAKQLTHVWSSPSSIHHIRQKYIRCMNVCVSLMSAIWTTNWYPQFK